MIEKRLEITKMFRFIFIFTAFFPLLVFSLNNNNSTCTAPSLRDCKCDESQKLVNCSMLQLKTVPVGIPKDTQILDLDSNNITELTDELIELSQLKTLNVSSNPLQCNTKLLIWVQKWFENNENTEIIGNCSIAFGTHNVPIQSLEGQDVIAFSDLDQKPEESGDNMTVTLKMTTSKEKTTTNFTNEPTTHKPEGESDNTVIIVVCIVAAVVLVLAVVLFVCLKRKKKSKRKSSRKSNPVYKGDKWKYEGVKSRDHTTEL